MLTEPKLIILDRDGVINQDSDNYIKSLEEFLPYPQAIKAIARLSQAGWKIAVATNQSGIARGFYDRQELQRMHDRLSTLVNEAGGHIAAIVYCPHGPDDDCLCRKPLPGLLHQLRTTLGLDSLEGGWMVGDSLRDLQAGAAVGCYPVLVRTGKGKHTETKGEELDNAMVFDDLAAFADWLLSQ